MKKTKLLASIAALALVIGLGACEVNVDVGDVDVGVDVNPSEDTSEAESTSESSSEDESTSESSSEEDTSESTSEDNTSENTSEDDTSENTSDDDSTPKEEEKGIVFGFELNGVLNAIDGKTQSEGTYRGSYTANLEDAVRVTYEEGETIGEYYLSFTLDGTTYWISIIEGDHTNLSYATEKTPIYYNPTYECWGNATQTYFLCQNATYQCLYASAISSWINSSPIASLYYTDGTKVTGFVGEVYEEPITDIPYFEVEEPEDGGQYYLGFPYTSSGSTDWYMFNGTTDSYGDYLQCSVLGYNDPTSAVLIKTTKTANDTWGLTFTLNSVEQTIYAWPSSNNSYGEITFTPTASLGSAKTGAVTEFGWDKDNGCFTVTLSNGDWYFETYQGKSSISLAKSSTNYTRAHLYTANSEYVIPEAPEVTTTYEQVSGLGNGGQFYAGGYSSSTLYLTTGKLSSYNLACTKDLDSAVPFTVTGDATSGYKLTNADGQYVYAYYAYNNGKYYHDFGLSTNTTVPNSGTNIFYWNDAASTLYCNGSSIGSTYTYCYFEFYNNNVAAYGTSTLNASTSNLAHFYQQVTA